MGSWEWLGRGVVDVDVRCGDVGHDANDRDDRDDVA